jgi:glycosyltransferase involved in cell wall biosynthesis
MSATIQNLRRLPFGSYVYYLLWQYTAANVAVRAHAKEKFDVVQHVSLGNCHFPSFMWKLGIPFIFGPVGGGEDTPKQLRRGLGLRGRIFDSLRRLFNSLLTHAPLVTATYVHATRIVVTTSETLREIPAHFRHKATVQQAVGIGPSGSHTPAGRRSAPPTMERPTELKLLYAGRLKPWKGLHLGLRALAALGPPRAEYPSHDSGRWFRRIAPEAFGPPPRSGAILVLDSLDRQGRSHSALPQVRPLPFSQPSRFRGHGCLGSNEPRPARPLPRPRRPRDIRR